MSALPPVNVIYTFQPNCTVTLPAGTTPTTLTLNPGCTLVKAMTEFQIFLHLRRTHVLGPHDQAAGAGLHYGASGFRLAERRRGCEAYPPAYSRWLCPRWLKRSPSAATVTAYARAYQTVSAVVTGVNLKTGTRQTTTKARWWE